VEESNSSSVGEAVSLSGRRGGQAVVRCEEVLIVVLAFISVMSTMHK